MQPKPFFIVMVTLMVVCNLFSCGAWIVKFQRDYRVEPIFLFALPVIVLTVAFIGSICDQLEGGNP